MPDSGPTSNRKLGDLLLHHRLLTHRELARALDALFPGDLLYVGLFNLILGNSLMVLVNMIGVFRRRNLGLMVFALANPFYWMLHSIASYKALWQLITKPFYWEKTNHGISKHAQSARLYTFPAQVQPAPADAVYEELDEDMEAA